MEKEFLYGLQIKGNLGPGRGGEEDRDTKNLSKL